MNKIIFSFLIVSLTIEIFAQGRFTSDSQMIYLLDQPQHCDVFFENNAASLNLSPGSEMIEMTSNASSGEHMAKKYKQTFKGIQVYGGYYFLHGKDNMVNYGNGKIYKNVNVDLLPIKTRNEVESLAKSFIKSKLGNGDKTFKNSDFKVENNELIIIDNLFPKNSGIYSLAYKQIVSMQQKNMSYEVIISAKDGSVIFSQSLICQHQVEGIGKTFYYGDQKITTDSIAPNNFVLRDLSRGNGNTTYTMKNGITKELIINKDNIWNDDIANDKVGIDAHYCTAKFYDLMVDSFDYNGLDGLGKSMNPVIHVDGLDKFINAFWDGSNAFFGHGDCHNGPLTTLDVVAHEFTHGVTQYNSNLIYSGESGALNEAISDIFGKSTEYVFDRKNFSWEVGKAFSLSQFSTIFRSFEDPNKFEHPMEYKGDFWNDNADVHINSSVLNHWFYILIEGNTTGIRKVDLMDVLKIVFLCQTSYLTPTSGYPEMYEYSLLACVELFGMNSDQFRSIKDAWKIVGLPNQKGTLSTRDLALVNNLSTPFITTCLSNEFYPINCRVKNNGTTIFKKSETLKFSIGLNNPTSKLINLKMDLAPGESEEVLIDDIVYFSERDFEYINIVLDNIDDIPDNNEYYIVIDNFVEQNLNVELSSAIVKQKSCFNEVKTFSFSASNISCNPIPAGEILELVIYTDDRPLVKKEIILANELTAGEYIRFLFESDVELNVTSYAALNFDKDENLDDNIFYFDYQPNTIISSPVAYDFETDDFETDFITSYALTPYYYEAESYLSCSGYKGNTAPCSAINENFADGLLSKTPVATVCLDLSNFSQPRLSFDMLQFRSDVYNYLNDKSFSDQTSMMQIEYSNDNVHFTKEFYGLEEGKLTHQSFFLPQRFKGQLKLKFYNSDGDGYISKSNISKIDAILIDNVSIENLSPTQNSNYDVLKILPNPANQTINLGAELLGKFKVDVSNAQGFLLSSKWLDNHQMDVSNLVAGLYFIKLSYRNGVSKSGKFIKI